jgi:hypothetical protein
MHLEVEKIFSMKNMVLAEDERISGVELGDAK